MTPRRPRTSTAALALAVATSLVVPVLSALVLASTSVASISGVTGPATTNLTAQRLDLGTLGGTSSSASAVDGSIVVGNAQTTSGTWRAFAYDLAAPKPVMRDLGHLGGGPSGAMAVDGSIVAGWSLTAAGDERAFAYDLASDEPTMLDLGTLGGFSSAVAVEGTIVTGWSENSSGHTRAFAYDLAAPEPAMQDLGGGDALAVDDRVVVGSFHAGGYQRAFAYDLTAAEPLMRDLGHLGGQISRATAIDDGKVVGSSRTGAKTTHAFSYDLNAPGPVMRDLGTLGGSSSAAAAISGSIVVGESHNAANQRRAFAYDLAAPQRGMRDLGTLGNARTRAIAVDGTRVAGEWVIPQRGTRAFAYDLSAVSPRLLDLGTWDGRSMASDIDGKVVVGRSAQHATAWVLRNTSQPMFAFRHFDRRVKEGAGRVTIRVTRYGRTDRDVTVRYRTRSDTAKAGQDFVATSGKLRFARGVTQRKLQVRIIDDRRREGNEHLLLTLSRPSSPALLGSPHWSQLLIKANDR